MTWLFVWAPINLLIGGLIGSVRGRAGTGMLLALILGPLGWLIIFCLDDRRPRCPHCAEVVQAEATLCPHCGRRLVRSASEAYAAWQSKTEDPVEKWAREQKSKGIDTDTFQQGCSTVSSEGAPSEEP